MFRYFTLLLGIIVLLILFLVVLETFDRVMNGDEANFHLVFSKFCKEIKGCWMTLSIGCLCFYLLGDLTHVELILYFIVTVVLWLYLFLTDQWK